MFSIKGSFYISTPSNQWLGFWNYPPKIFEQYDTAVYWREMSMGSWSSGQRISWESSSSLPWFLYTSSDFTREFALTQEGNHFHRRFEWTWFGTEAKSYVMALGSAQVPASQIFFLQSPAQVYKGSDLCWNLRCDFSWVTGSSSLTKRHEPQGKVGRPWGVAAFATEQDTAI